MRIYITAKPGAKEEKIEKVSENQFVVAVKEPPVQGKANAAIVKSVAAHFHVGVSNVRIVSGFTSRQKLIEIDE